LFSKSDSFEDSRWCYDDLLEFGLCFLAVIVFVILLSILKIAYDANPEKREYEQKRRWEWSQPYKEAPSTDFPKDLRRRMQ